MCGRSGGAAVDEGATKCRIFAGCSRAFGSAGELASFPGSSAGGASAKTFRGVEAEAGATGSAIGLSSAGAAASEVMSALRCSRCGGAMARNCFGREPITGRSGEGGGTGTVSVAGVCTATTFDAERESCKVGAVIGAAAISGAGEAGSGGDSTFDVAGNAGGGTTAMVGRGGAASGADGCATTGFSIARAGSDSAFFGVAATAATSTVLGSFGVDAALGFSHLWSGRGGIVAAGCGGLAGADAGSRGGSGFEATGGAMEGASADADEEPSSAPGVCVAAASGLGCGTTADAISCAGGASIRADDASGSPYDQMTA